MISQQHKCIFIHINKSGGGMSIDSAIGGLKKPEHKCASWYRQHKNLQFRNYFKFAFVRNPWEKVVSQWAFRTQKIDKSNLPFLTWVQNPTGMVFIPQRRWLVDTNFYSNGHPVEDAVTGGEILVDYVGYYQEFRSEWEYVCSQIGFDPNKLPHLHKSDHGDYRQYYTDEVAEMIGDIYAEDIQEWGFQF